MLSNVFEIWEVKDVIFFESENKLLGIVAVIDGFYVIVKVVNVMLLLELLLCVFKVFELEFVLSESVEGSVLI